MNTETKKPVAKVLGKDGNVFNLISICSTALKNAGLKAQANEMTNKVMSSVSYHEALSIMGQYCELI
jgi:hypothetical protein